MKKIFLLSVLFVISMISQSSIANDSVTRFDHPVSYKNKRETSFKVIGVADNAAVAVEASDTIGKTVFYNGQPVIIYGSNFYDYQIVTVQIPFIIGTLHLTTSQGRPRTLPVIYGYIKQ